MAPAVPFALVGVVQLVAIAGWVALAGAACFPATRRPSSVAFVAGALALAAADTITAVQVGQPRSTLVPLLRAGGFALLAVGLASGVLQGRSGGRCGASGQPPAALAGVVVPLGAAGGPGAAAAALGGVAVAAVFAGAAGRRRRWQARDLPLAGLLAGTVATAAAAAALAVPAATSPGAAVGEIVVRACSAAGAFAVCVRLARRSLLARVVIAILAGVVAMAAAAVGVVGTTVAAAVSRQQVTATRQAGRGEVAALAAAETDALRRAELVTACTAARAHGCGSLFSTFAVEPDFFAAVVRPGHRLQRLAGGRLGLVASAQLAREPLVDQAFRRGAVCGSGLLLLQTAAPALAVIGVAPDTRTGCGTTSLSPAGFAGVFGVRYTDLEARTIAGQISYGVTLLGDGQVLASSLRGAARRSVAAAYGRLGAGPLPAAGATVAGSGGTPTVSFLPLDAPNTGGQVAVLAVSLPVDRLVAAERSVLIGLFLTAVAVLLVVAALGLLLGRTIVEPVRRLTEAARRIRGGDLAVAAATPAVDEVGVLSRSFDAMTAALRRRTEDLRVAAATEATLRRRLQTVLDSMQDGLLTTDAVGRVTGANPAAEQLLGSAAGTLTGRPLSEVLDVEDGTGRPWLAVPGAEADGVLHRPGGPLPVRVAAAALGAVPALGKGAERSGPAVAPRGSADAARGAAEGNRGGFGAEGEPGAVGEELGAVREPGSDGEAVPDGVVGGLLVVVRDTTREREVERLKTEFLSNVSHELRTPLTPIRGYAELLARRTFPPAQTAEFLATIHASSLRMQRVVDLLVDVAALEAGRVRARRRETDVAAFAAACLRRWRARWPERAEDFRRRVAGGLPAVDIDPEWIGKACDELADNAVKYTRPGTPIVLFAAAAGPDQVRCGVRDAGPGVPAELLPALLGDFAQADGSETRMVGGLGLGLGFVRRLAEAFGLDLHARSELGRGSEFALDLPVVGPPGPGEGARGLRAAADRWLVRGRS